MNANESKVQALAYYRNIKAYGPENLEDEALREAVAMGATEPELLQAEVDAAAWNPERVARLEARRAAQARVDAKRAARREALAQCSGKALPEVKVPALPAEDLEAEAAAAHADAARFQPRPVEPTPVQRAVEALRQAKEDAEAPYPLSGWTVGGLFDRAVSEAVRQGPAGASFMQVAAWLAPRSYDVAFALMGLSPADAGAAIVAALK